MAYHRFMESRAANRPEKEQLNHLKASEQFCQQAISLSPLNAMNDLANTHNVLGVVYIYLSALDHALQHFREAIRYHEAQNDLYKAAQTRFNVALALRDAGRLADAREYAYAARRNFETYGQATAAEIQNTQQLLAVIKHEMGKIKRNPFQLLF